MSNRFDIKRDAERCENGGFFCEACLVGKSDGEQSIDPRYCKDCCDFLLKEKEQLTPGRKKNPDWSPKDADDKSLKPDKTCHVLVQPVAKIPNHDVIGVADEKLFMQHHKGRPRKAGEVCRVSLWRRRKAQEKQGVLV